MSNPGAPTFGEPGTNPYAGTGPGYGSYDRTGTVNLNANAAQYQQEMGRAAASTTQVSGAVVTLLGHVDNLFKLGGRSLKIIGAGDAAALAAGVSSVAALETQMSSLHATSEINRGGFAQYSKAVDNAFSKFPQHRADVVGLVTEVTNLGTKSRDVEAVATSVTKLGAASGESIPALANDLLLLNRQFGNTNARDVATYANSVLTVSRNAGVGVGNVLQFAQAIAPIARQAGIGEAAVLGISTAFSKAGADGFVAANTFNTIVNDITTMVRTGSPELAKYANFVGATADQFRKLPPAQQVSEIFAAIGKGGPQALSFLQTQGFGIRQLSAIQAVAQSGGLSRYIGMAQGSATNTRNLDRGAEVAMSGLGDQLAIVRHQFTRLGDTLAGPLLSPITALTHGFGSFLSITNSVVHALGPIPSLLAGMTVVLAPLAGFALGHAGLVAGAATVRMLASPNSGPRRALTEGRSIGLAMRGGMSREEAMAMNESGQRYVAGALPFRAAAPFQYGMAQGQAGGRLRDRFFPGFGGPSSAFRAGLSGMSRVEFDASRAAAAQAEAGRAGLLKMGFTGVTQGAGALPGWYFRTQTRAMDDSRVGDYSRSAYPARLPGGGFDTSAGLRARASVYAAEVRATAENTSAMGLVARQGLAVGRAFGETAVATVRAAGSMTAMGVGAATGRVGALAGGIGRAAFSLPGMVALLGLPPLLSAVHSADRQPYQVDNQLNTIGRYDSLLGQTSTNLADFSRNLNDAGARLKILATNGKSLAQIAQVTPADIARSSGGYKVTDSTITALAGRPGSGGAAVAYLQTLGITHGGMDPKTLQAVKQDLVHAYGPTRAQQIITSYMQTNPASLSQSVDYGQIGRAARGASPDALKDLFGAAVTGTQAQSALAPGRTGNRAQLGALLQTFATGLQGVRYGNAGDQVRSTREYLSKVFGGKQSDYTMALPASSDTNLDETSFNRLYGSSQTISRDILMAITKTKEGRAYLRAAGFNVSSRPSSAQLNSILSQVNGAGFPSTSTSPQNDALRSQGGLGVFAAGNASVQAALGTQSGSPAATQRAVEALAGQSIRTSGNLGDAAGALTKLSDAMGGASTATGQLLSRAAAWTRTLQSFQMPYESRVGQLRTLAGNVRASEAAAARPGASQETIDQAHNDRAAYEQQKAAQAQYLQSVYTTAREFRIGQVRSEEDYHISVFRSQRNFEIQMQQSEEDFYRSRRRTITDFNIQMKRQAQSAAESIYNPYQRVQSQSVMNAGMLESNLEDQNARIERQYEQLKRLRRLGLSQSAIDTLQLSKPENAQQVNALVDSVASDPEMIRKINKSVGERRHATSQLTQSRFNEDFRNTMADFTRGLDRAAKDFDTARQRANDAQRRSLGDMADDYNRMVARSGEDLTRQMTELYGSYTTQYTRAIREINKSLGQYAPEIARKLVAELTKADNEINGVVDHYTGQGGGGSGGGGKPGSSTDSPIYTPNTVGINERGQYGEYDKGGHWHSISTKGLSPDARAQAPHVASPKALNANTPGGAQAYAKSRFKHYGWAPNQFSSLDRLWSNESGWSYKAYNDGSGAIGIPQLLPRDFRGHHNSGGHSIPSGYVEDGRVQIDWGLNYIKNRYGSPSAAAAFEFSHDPHWYAAGGIFPAGARVIGIGEKGPETVLPLDHRGVDFMAQFIDRVSSAMASRMHTLGRGVAGSAPSLVSYDIREDHSTNYHGDIKVAAADPREFERRMAERQRYRRLSQPAHAGP